jgi:hypothetical protein
MLLYIVFCTLVSYYRHSIVFESQFYFTEMVKLKDISLPLPVMAVNVTNTVDIHLADFSKDVIPSSLHFVYCIKECLHYYII